LAVISIQLRGEALALVVMSQHVNKVMGINGGLDAQTTDFYNLNPTFDHILLRTTIAELIVHI